MHRKQLLMILLLTGVFLLPMLAIVDHIVPDPPVYARAGELSMLVPQESAHINFELHSSGQNSVFYNLWNTSEHLMFYDNIGDRIEVKKDGKWYALKELSPSSRPDMRPLPAGKGVHIQVYSEPLYGKLSRGEYRILNQVYPDGSPSNAYWIAKEFKIK